MPEKDIFISLFLSSSNCPFIQKQRRNYLSPQMSTMVLLPKGSFGRASLSTFGKHGRMVRDPGSQSSPLYYDSYHHFTATSPDLSSAYFRLRYTHVFDVCPKDTEWVVKGGSLFFVCHIFGKGCITNFNLNPISMLIICIHLASQ